MILIECYYLVSYLLTVILVIHTTVFVVFIFDYFYSLINPFTRSPEKLKKLKKKIGKKIGKNLRLKTS